MLGHEDYKNLRRLRELNGAGAATEFVRELFESKQVKADSFRLAPLFFAVCPEAEQLRAEFQSGGFSDNTKRRLKESDGVMSGEFSNINGQIVYSKMMEFFQHEDFVFTKEVDTMTSSFLDNEKIAGIGRIGDDVEVVGERQLFPETGPSQAYIHAPPGVKRGQKCSLSWEAVFADRTGQLLREAGEVGY